MTPPDTNVEKQAKRHKGPLGGMTLAVVFASVLFAIFYVFVISGGEDEEGAPAPAQVEEAAPATGDGAANVEDAN
ncbi:MAG: hypothetical protein ACE369_06900 [Roseovarius sp.]